MVKNMIGADSATAEELIVALVAYREAAGEPYLGKVAVVWTLKNRKDHPKWWGHDYYSVATARWQYSSMTDPRDSQLTKWPRWDDPVFQRCLEIVRGVIGGVIFHPLPGSDSYYSDYIPSPRWATPDKFVGKISHHSFYNMDGDYE